MQALELNVYTCMGQVTCSSIAVQVNPGSPEYLHV